MGKKINYCLIGGDSGICSEFIKLLKDESILITSRKKSNLVNSSVSWFNLDVSSAVQLTEFDNYLKNLKWQLIQGTIFRENKIGLDNQEVIEFTKSLLISNFAQYGIPAPEEKELLASAMQVLQNREEANRVYDMLAEQKLSQYFKTTVKLNEKVVSYDKFVEMAAK